MDKLDCELSKGSIFDSEIEPYLIEKERQLSIKLRPKFLAKVERLNNDWTVYSSVAPISMLYFHVRLALWIKHIQNLRGNNFILSLDNVVLGHIKQKQYGYLPLEGKRLFTSLLRALDINVDSKRIKIYDWRLLYEKILAIEGYFSYLHSIDIVDLANTLSPIEESEHFRKLIDLKTYADDVFIASTSANIGYKNFDFIAGAIDRIPTYSYCSDVLWKEQKILSPVLLPIASMPIIGKGEIGPYPSLEDVQYPGLIRKKIQRANLSNNSLILILKTLLQFYEDVTGDSLDSIKRVPRNSYDTLTTSRLRIIIENGLEELFSLLWNKMKIPLPSESKELCGIENIQNLFLGLGSSTRKFEIFKIILAKPSGITASEIHKKIPTLDKSTVYRMLRGLEYSGLVKKNKYEAPHKYYPVARKILMRINCL